jgi:hypothetical protein
MLNKQEVFTKVKNHLLTQRQKSIRDSAQNSRCVYRGPSGLMCAIGCLIPDSKYTKEMDHHEMDVHILMKHFSGIFDDVFDIEDRDIIHMLYSLQSTHDKFPVCDWEKLLMMAAKRYGVNYDA